MIGVHVTWLNVPDLLTTQKVMQYSYHLSDIYLQVFIFILRVDISRLCLHCVALCGLLLYSEISNMAKNILLVVLCIGATVAAAAPKSNTRVLRTNTQVTKKNLLTP